MNIFQDLLQVFNLRKIIRWIMLAGIPAGVFYIASILILKLGGFNLIEILRDPAQQNEQSSFLGFLSNVGNWLWIASAAISFFAATRIDPGFGKRLRELLILVGLFSMTLAIDDFFLIHDRYINEFICYAVYAFLAGALLVRHYKTILNVDGFAFLAAGSFLALSILTDMIQNYIPLRYSYTQVFEEGFKFIGAATWLYFSFRIAASGIAPAAARPPRNPEIKASISG
jgi:hypothetical protein